MIQDLKYYLLVMRISLKNRDNKEMLMKEISTLAIKNWVDREDGKPDLTKEQLNRAMVRALAKRDVNDN
jgi:hypothetical protein